MIKIRKLTTAIGAEISGVDLSKPLEPAMVKAIKTAWLENLVIFFRGQKQLTIEEHNRLALYFGEIHYPLFRPENGDAQPEMLVLDTTNPGMDQRQANWHADQTFFPNPQFGSIFQTISLPEVGGDTLWASMYAAYDALSTPMQAFLEDLTAVHDAQMALGGGPSGLTADLSKTRCHSHPVVAVHPESGRKLLFVNKNWTSHIEGVSSEESELLLGFLFNHVKHPAFQLRFNWKEGDIAFWDNRATQHLAVPDYTTRRVVRKINLVGSPLFAPSQRSGSEIRHLEAA